MKTMNALPALFSLFLLASSVGCAHAPTAAPYDAVVVDRSNPDKVVITLSGVACEQPRTAAVTAPEISSAASSPRNPAESDREKLAFPFTTEDGTTYYFGSDSARTRFIQAHDINSRY